MATDTTITLKWKASGAVDLAGYKVYWSPFKGVWGVNFLMVKKTQNWLTLTLPAGARYYFAVASFDVAGNESAKALIKS